MQGSYIIKIGETELDIESVPGVFSPGRADRGTLAMLSRLELAPGSKLLDLGCGCGLVGIYAAKQIGAENVWMSDIDTAAVGLASRNARLNGVPEVNIVVSDGFRSIGEKDFTHILSNPPYHADFSIPRHFIEKGFNRLATGGVMLLVTKREAWYKNKLTSIFGGVSIREIDGYFVFSAQKRSASYANK